MNLMMWIARSAGLVCARFTALCQRTSRGLASILPTSNLRHSVLTSTYVNVIDSHGTLTARAHQGLTARRLRIARGVAIVIGIALSMQSTAVGQGSIDRYTDLKSLADYQLTDRQYKCHNEIVHRESSFRANARNGSHHGYYQIRNTKLIDAPYDYQFYFYWKYVQHRYGYTEYDEPDYCKALHHLKTKGWQ
jgi:hypothetical protein